MRNGHNLFRLSGFPLFCLDGKMFANVRWGEKQICPDLFREERYDMTEAATKPMNKKGKPETSLVTLNFKITPAFRKEFKGYAVNHGLTMVELLKEGFELSRTRRKPQ